MFFCGTLSPQDAPSEISLGYGPVSGFKDVGFRVYPKP